MINRVDNSNVASAFYAGVQGYNQGAEKVVGASVDLSSANNPNRESTVNINKSAVELISGSLQAEASAKVIKAADETLGSIIDTYA
ncbi:MAG: flagellar basal body rod protein FlgG [Glaciecola sp.]|jgi:flagellar basal body rod protein FlgG